MQLHSNVYAIAKASREESARLESLLVGQERRIKEAFNRFLKEVRSDATVSQVSTYLETGNINAAMRLVNQHVIAMGRVISTAFVQAANAETDKIAAMIPNESRVAITFDAGSERAASLIRSAQLKFVQQFDNAQRAAVRVALANAYANGASTAQAADAFVDSIGLTEFQSEAVNNYRKLLETGSAEALSRDLRDRRYDRTVARASEEPLDASQIDRMVDRYRENFLKYRAENIARTEGLGVVGAARQEALAQATEQAGFDPTSIRRTWRAVNDKRTRDTHRDMDGQTVGADEPFESPTGEEIMFPGDPDASAAERINCRCTITYDFVATEA